jgi:hypothetical protein
LGRFSAGTLFACFLGVALAAALPGLTVASAALDIESFDGTALDAAGNPASQAGSHPFISRTEARFTIVPSPGGSGPHEPAGVPYPNEAVKDGAVGLPPGFIVNPRAVPTCSQVQFAHQVASQTSEPCAPETQVGYVVLRVGGLLTKGEGISLYFPLYNMEPLPGTPALFAVNASGLPIYLSGRLRTGDDYGIEMFAKNAPATISLLGAKVIFWGIPGDPAHDRDRGTDGTESCADPLATESQCASHPSKAPLRPFVTIPTSCTGPIETTFAADTWDDLGNFVGTGFLSHDNEEPPSPIGVDGCNAVDFSPSLEARPTTNVADAASGLDVDLHTPQHEACALGPPATCENAEAHLRDVTVTLPEGLVANPAAANGLGACSEAQFGFTSKEGDVVHTTPDPAECPDAAKLGTVEAETPMLDQPLKGDVYMAEPFDNPSGSLFAIYATLDDASSGIVVKLAGEVHADETTGRLTASFKGNPQLPFEHLRLHLFGGAGAPLATPPICGTYTTRSVLTPWTAPNAAPAISLDSYAIQRSADGGSCPQSAEQVPNSPSVDAGTESPIAGDSTPFVFRLSRESGGQLLRSFSLTAPPGLTASLAEVSPCPPSIIASISATPGSARSEAAQPSCPDSSRVGTIKVGAGAGPSLLYLDGSVYLTGPYEGAPFGLAVVVPVIAGPFDLGTIVLRIAVEVDPADAQLRLRSDPLPSAIAGVPLDLRMLDLRVDRPRFIRNPTSCDATRLTVAAISSQGAVSDLSNRFQVGECAALGLRPRFHIRFSGGVGRNGRPAVTVRLEPRPGDANLSAVALALPEGELLKPAHLVDVCTKEQSAIGNCPPASRHGWARAWSPLLKEPLQGPIYLRESDKRYPEVAADLDGEFQVSLSGKLTTPHGRIRVRFGSLPDVPISRLELEFPGGREGLLANSESLCGGRRRAGISVVGHNGSTRTLRPPLDVSCRSRRGHNAAH